ncbi:MAG: LacI family DNA-binding transcriptional regulator [Propionibacteriaceae bacterium]|nr:LacI family DNA-binding transcriptional regulator [Propionibacteriaceae bacterium]
MRAQRRRTGPSIRDVARLAGVSAQTVSRVSTGAETVRPETRAKVLHAMEQLGYSPNRAARALRLGRFGALGIMAHRYERTGEALSTAAVIDAAESMGYSVNLVSIQTADADHWKDAAHRMSHQAIDGLIIIRAELTTPEMLTLPPGLPVIVSDSRLIGHYPAVTADQAGGSRMAVEHLLGLGHRTVHHLAGPTDSEPALIRRATWEHTLNLAGVDAPEPWVGDWTPAAGYSFGLRAAADPDITAVYVANDEMAMGFLRALHESGRRVPQDVSVVGFDGLALGAYAYPPLTTVKQDFPGIGQKLVELLLEQIRLRGTNHVPPARTVLPVELIVRSSTGPAPVR